jgi:hypothetical protein
MFSRGTVLLLVSLLCCAPPALAQSSCSPPARPRIAELLYDAASDDTGREFVELWNPWPLAYSLAGVRLEVGDGSGPGRWTTHWTGAAGDSIAGLGRFVIGGGLVNPPPDRVAELALQNGPDAIRLRWPDGMTEVVGYGAPLLAEYFCGAPAEDVPAGQSLARIPDDADRGSNALDFRAAAPSPGGANQLGLDLALLPGSSVLEPEQPAPFAASRLRVRVANRGARPAPPGAARCFVLDAVAPDTLAAAILTPVPAPAETLEAALALPGLAAGKRRLVVSVALAGDERRANDTDTLAVRVGPGPLELTEIQFHPTAGEGEWVEVRNRDGAPLAPQKWTMSDRRGTRGVIASNAALAAESLAVLAQDRAALLAHFPALDSTRVWSAAPWPSLNNSNAEDGIADAVVLREPDGTLVERIDYSAAGVPPGTSLERHGDLWEPSPLPAGSPLAPPRVTPVAAGGFEVEPRSLAHGARPTLRWSLPWDRARASCEAYDLAGRKRGTLMAESLVPGRAERVAEVGALTPGLYLVVLQARPESGDDVLTVSRALRVAGSR